MLQFVYWALRVLNWLNWIAGTLFAVLLAVLLAYPAPFEAQLSGSSIGPSDTVLGWLTIVFVLGLMVVPLAHLVLTRLAAIIATVREAASFSEENAARLTTIAWSILGINVIDLAFGIASVRVSEATGEYFGWSPALTGWLAVLLLFVLARVFREGAAMRADLEGTV